VWRKGGGNAEEIVSEAEARGAHESSYAHLGFTVTYANKHGVLLGEGAGSRLHALSLAVLA
jgi:hypothetical protein